MKLFKEKIGLTPFCLGLSLYTLVAFHWPFFSHALQQVEPGFNGVVILLTAALLLLGLNFLLYSLLLWCGRVVGKILIGLTFVADAIMLYAVNAYDVLVTDEMMGNVLRTQGSEVAGFLTWQPFVYVILLAGPPVAALFACRLEYGSFKRMMAAAGVTLGLVLALGNRTDEALSITLSDFTVNGKTAFSGYYSSCEVTLAPHATLPYLLILNAQEGFSAGEAVREVGLSAFDGRAMGQTRLLIAEGNAMDADRQAIDLVREGCFLHSYKAAPAVGQSRCAGAA